MNRIIEKGICPNCGKPLKVGVNRWGREVPIECGCVQHNQQALKSFLSSIGDRYRDKTLDNYVEDTVTKADSEHVALIRMMEKDFPRFLESGTGALVLGSYGCGKTHLEVGLAKKLIMKGYSVKMFDACSLYDAYIVAGSWKVGHSPMDVINDACNADLLILDDVGVNTIDTDKDRFANFIYALINTRYNQQKPVLISTNLRKADLQNALTMRVYDRIIGMTYCVTNKRKSMRPQERKLV